MAVVGQCSVDSRPVRVLDAGECRLAPALSRALNWRVMNLSGAQRAVAGSIPACDRAQYTPIKTSKNRYSLMLCLL